MAAGLVLVTLLPAASPIADLTVDVTGLRSDKGVVRLCLTRDPSNFPGCVDDTNAVTRSVPAREARSIRIDGLAQGDYAIALIHDENDNAKLDTFAGLPREGFGFSRNPAIGFGPPRFSAASFVLTGGASEQAIRMRYIL